MKIPVFSKNRALDKEIEGYSARLKGFFSPVFFDDADSFLQYLKFELPQFNIIDFRSNGKEVNKIIRTIKKDTWLHAGGVIGVHKEEERKLLQRIHMMNIISLVHESESESGIPRVLKIVKENSHILFNRDLQRKLLSQITGSLTMDNDPLEVRTYANLVTNYLFNTNYINQDQRETLHVALFEMLMNAVEHGNCGISYEEKTAWLENGGDSIELIRSKMKYPGVKKKKVHFSYNIRQEDSTFTIRDEGKGFDWRTYTEWTPGEGAPTLHGLGIKMTAIYTESLWYNDKGNEVSFRVKHMQNESNLIPNVLEGHEETAFRKNQIIFREGEESNFLYYIVSGELVIYSKGTEISRLTPKDVFLGEMSFLLSNRRSATVKAGSPCVLIKVSKDQFLDMIKDNPHYGILLARLIAQRLTRLHEFTNQLQTVAVQPEMSSSMK